MDVKVNNSVWVLLFSLDTDSGRDKSIGKEVNIVYHQLNQSLNSTNCLSFILQHLISYLKVEIVKEFDRLYSFLARCL